MEKSKFHGSDGPLYISKPRYVHEISQGLINAANEECKVDYNGDFGGATLEGFGPYHMNQWSGRRWSAAQGYIDTRDDESLRDHLDIVTNARVDQVILEDDELSDNSFDKPEKRAMGIRYYKNFTTSSTKSSKQQSYTTVLASKEVILGAGVFGSPQILNLSGIGEENMLRRLGIETHINLPGVGKNLMDHVDIAVTCSNPSREALGVSAVGVSRCVAHLLSYLKDHCKRKSMIFSSNSKFDVGNDFSNYFMGNMFMSNGVDSGGFARSSDEVEYPDIQFHFFPGSFRNYSLSGFFSHSYSTNVYLSRPKSRGEVSLRSRNVFDDPIIRHNFLEEQQDVDVLLKGVKIARKIMSSDALEKYRGSEIEPGGEKRTDRDVELWLRNNCKSAHHPVGTCKMGSKNDPRAVVDSTLRVFGTKNLRVVDGSVFPSHVTGNPWSTIVAIAEKSAAMMTSK